MSGEKFWGTWGGVCPECGELYSLPVHPAPVMYQKGQEPRRPEFDAQKVLCCGKAHEITPTNIEWVHVENYEPALR